MTYKEIQEKFGIKPDTIINLLNDYRSMPEDKVGCSFDIQGITITIKPTQR